MKRLFCLATISWLLVATGRSFAEQKQTFALQDGDRVVFYGDSITEQRFYTWWAELYVVTRFPAAHIRFWNAGVGGDRVTGGFGGDIDKRLTRDVFAHTPTVVTIMLGMNDGSYAPLTPAIEKTYSDGYERILRTIEQQASSTRIVCIGPSPYDETTRNTPLFPGGYNKTLVRFGEIDRELAHKFGAQFTDANAPFVASLKNALSEDRLASQMLVPDRIHPDLPAHLLIAMAVLRSWNAPALVSSSDIDAEGLSVGPASMRVKIDHLTKTGQGIAWTSLEEGLPMPLDSGNASLQFMQRISSFAAEFNQEPLAVHNLKNGPYTLRIDGKTTGVFTDKELDAGINLADLDTPMRRQSQNVEWTVRDKGDLQFVRTRILIRESSPNADAALTKAEEQMQQMIWHDAQPTAHNFELNTLAQTP